MRKIILLIMLVCILIVTYVYAKSVTIDSNSYHRLEVVPSPTQVHRLKTAAS